MKIVKENSHIYIHIHEYIYTHIYIWSIRKQKTGSTSSRKYKSSTHLWNPDFL